MQRLMIAGGGTGGHIIPLIAVARKIKEKEISAEFMFLGPKENFSKKFMTAEGITIKHAMSGKMRRYFSILNFVDALKIPIGIVQALWHLLWFMPEVIFSKGGCATLPVVIAGWLYHIPILIHESDANPGMANSVLAKLASRVAVSYPSAESYFHSEQVVVTGSPLREDINKGNKENAQKMFSLLESKKTIFIWGGSQGAKAINDKILEVLPELLPNYQIIHQTGEKNFEEVKNEAKVVIAPELEKFYHPVGFLKEIELREAYAASDLILSRAGSGSIFEIAALGKPSVLVPLALAAQDHQAKNAYAYADGSRGATLVIEEANLTPRFLLEKIKYTFAVPGELEKMSKAAKSFAKPDSGRLIAEYIMNYYKK